MRVADEQLALIGSALDAWDREDAALATPEPSSEPFAEALALSEALRPIVGITIALGAGPAPGADSKRDAEWAAAVALARRDVLAARDAGIDHGLAIQNLRLLDRIDLLIGPWPDDDWDDLARQRVTDLVDARKRGRQRGLALRNSDPKTIAEEHLPRGWLPRHPTDHWLCGAVPRVADRECRSLLVAQIVKLAPSYQRLCELDWTAEEAAADVIYETRILGAHSGSWKEPVLAVVAASVNGAASPGQQIAIGLVADPEAPFNGTLVSVLTGERWRICARQRDDGTLLPVDGTRRLAAPSVKTGA